MLPLLPLIILIPFLSTLPLFMLDERYAPKISAIVSLISLVLVVVSVALYMYGHQDLSFNIPYLPFTNASVGFVLTQAGAILLLMTAIVFFAAGLVGEYFVGNERIYWFTFLLSEGSALAVFTSSNLFLLYVFWEIAEVMMFFIIYRYGGYEKKYAAVKFIVYSLFSSLLFLLGIFMLYSYITPHTFSISTIEANSSTIPLGLQTEILLLLLTSFMIKIPIFPFHTWLPDAHTEAPTTGSMILAGVLLKFGGYGLILTFYMLPMATHYAIYIAAIFIFSSVYSAVVSLRQINLKRAIAYTSVTDMGIVALGIATGGKLGITGALYAMLSHGLAIAMLFLIAGTLNEAYGTLYINKIKGVILNFRPLAYLFILGSLATIGMPFTAGFIGDILIFISSFASFGAIGLIPLAGIILIGAMLFWIIERVFLGGKGTRTQRNVPDVITYVSVFLLASTILFGVLPMLLIR